MSIERPDIKCVIVGHQYTGKTCLFTRIHRGLFNPNPKTTLDICGTKMIPVEIDGQDNPIKISLWDTIGDDRFVTPTRQFTRNANAALICCSLDNTDFDLEKAKFWTHVFLKDSPDCKLYLVGTKCDLVKQPNNEKKLKDYANLYNAVYIETSAKENINITELIRRVASDWICAGRKGSQGKLIQPLLIEETPSRRATCCN